MIKVNGSEVLFEKFPNGETKLIERSIEHAWNVISRISFKYEDDSDLIKLMFVKNYLDTIKSGKAILTIYYMPYSRMDRSENDSPFTLKYVANFINSLNFDEIDVVEPHSDVTPALLNNVNSFYVNFELIERVKLEVGFDEDNDYIMFPDAGASKRYSKMRAKNVIVGNKNRDFETGVITGLTLNSEFLGSGKKVIIADDLSSFGGTFVKSAEALRKEGFEEIYLLVAHAENSIFKGQLFNHMTKVFTTDTLLTEQDNLAYKAISNDKLKIYDIEEVLFNV